MQLLRQLTEQDEDQTLAAELVKAVKGAATYLDIIGPQSGMLYRGIRRGDELDPIAYVTIRQDRRPSDSSPLFHEALNARLKEQFGYPYRTASMFMTGHEASARHYGQTRVVLPQGGIFRYCWGTMVIDAYEYFEIGQQLVSHFVKNASDELAFNSDLQYAEHDPTIVHDLITSGNEEAIQLFNDWFDKKFKAAGYGEVGLPQAIASKHEVMFASPAPVALLDHRRLNSRWVKRALQEQVPSLSIPDDATPSDIIHLLHSVIN